METTYGVDYLALHQTVQSTLSEKILILTTSFYFLLSNRLDIYASIYTNSNHAAIMDSSMKAKRCRILDDIRRLHYQVEAHPSEFFGPKDLGELGIRAAQVSLNADGERIQFNPCYFEPLSPQIIRNHPITDPECDEVVPLNYCSEDDSGEDMEEDTEEDMEKDVEEHTEDSGSESSDNIAKGSSIDISQSFPASATHIRPPL